VKQITNLKALYLVITVVGYSNADTEIMTWRLQTASTNIDLPTECRVSVITLEYS